MKWIKLYGDEHVYCDNDERIVGSVLVSQFDGTTTAFYEDDKIGRYVTEDAARTAVEVKHKDGILN